MPLPYQLTANRESLEEFSRSRAMGVPYGGGRILCRLMGEFPAFVATDDLGVGPRLVLDGFWEAWETLALARYVQPGMWCVDVGANYGYYTLLMAAAAGSEGRVLACEPHPLLAEQLLPANLTINGFESRVEICPLAISNRDGQVVEFEFHRGNIGSSSLAGLAGVGATLADEGWPGPRSDRREVRLGSDCGMVLSGSERGTVMPGVAVQRVQVQTATLDRLCADWPRLDLVKIDAEGAEALVWEGMQETLDRFPHAAVLVELHLQRDPPQIASFLHQLERSGYSLRFVNYDGDVVPIDPATIIANPQEHWMLWVQK
jgi:FkbM family methyltransferase